MPSIPRIIHHGAVNGVTGSCHELEYAPASSILVDCGMFQGAETSASGAGPDSLAIDFPLTQVRALVVTHVHIDHVGRIPYLLAGGFEGPIYCSEPSALLLPEVIEDALKIGVSRDRRLVEGCMRRLRQQIVALPYGRWATPGAAPEAALAIRLHKAGHILGSAYVECRVETGEGAHTVVFSGDLGAPHAPLLSPPQSPVRADTLVLESTYGDRDHDERKHRSRRLQQIIERSLQDRGAVLIPAFSIGRTQELLYELEDIVFRNRDALSARGLPWRELEIVVDSPLASRFTRLYRKLKPFWDQEAKQRLTDGRHPLSFEQLRTVDSHSDHMAIVNYVKSNDYPCIVLAASGMCAGGRIVNYLKALVEQPTTDIVFVGYQARGTPGRAIQSFGPKGGYVELDGSRYWIKAGVHTLSGYSAHADKSDLAAFVAGMAEVPSEIRLIHGERRAKESLARLLQERYPACNVVIPT